MTEIGPLHFLSLALVREQPIVIITVSKEKGEVTLFHNIQGETMLNEVLIAAREGEVVYDE